MLLLVLLAWLCLAPLAALVVGSCIRLAEQELDFDAAADVSPYQRTDEAADEPVAISA
jgi:hypothetical protein